MNLDMNGLKAINDIGGHTAGNDALKMFADILKSGKTTEWLKEMGLEVTSSAEGGDEFGIVISGNVNLQPILGEIQDRYFQEVKNSDASGLIDFSQEAVQAKLKEASISIDPDFKFEIGISVGAVTLREAIAAIDVGAAENYQELVQMIANKMFQTADGRANEHKDYYKNQVLARQNPALRSLYNFNRQNLESELKVKSLEKENAQLKKEIERLAAHS
jgi:GGDEF domain-containing protein